MVKVLALMISLGFGSGCVRELCHGFFPENTMQIPVSATMTSGQGITETQFNSALDKFAKVMTPAIVAKGGTLVLSRRWTDPAVNASAQQVGNLWLINMYGGLARYPIMTEDAFLFVACHEIGHHLGGAPKAAPTLGVKNWATNEGGADYYAGLKCLRRIFAGDDNETIVAGLKVHPHAAVTCQSQFPNRNDELICLRTSVASEILGTVMKEVLEIRDGRTITQPQLTTPDLSEVTKTFDGHPEPQCRLDTYFAGTVCEAKSSDDVSDSDVAKGACVSNLTPGTRPKCWFASSGALVSKRVEQKLAQNGFADVMVWLRRQTSLEEDSLDEDRDTRIGQIYRQLVTSAGREQKSIVQLLNDRKVQHRAFHIANVIHIEAADVALINLLRVRPDVARIETNFSSTKRSVTVDRKIQTTKVETSIQASGAETAWAKFKTKGNGIVVASADSGVEWSHPALRRKYRGFSPLVIDHNYHWHDAIHRRAGSSCVENSQDPCDDTSHGTHTTGTMVGDDEAGNQIGMAPDAKWIACRNMNQGEGTLASYLECFEYFLAPYPYAGNPRQDGRPDMAPHIINNSWSCPTSEGCGRADLIDVMRVMRAARIAVVVAAGNDGSSCGSLQDPPGTYSGDVVSVAAYNRYAKEIAYFSSRGPSGFDGGVGIDITAHGVGIRSAVVGGRYDEKDGTSMASPHVAGAIALLWSYKPSLIGMIDETVKLLRLSARPATNGENCGGFSGRSVPNTSFGYGMLDVVKLLELAP